MAKPYDDQQLVEMSQYEPVYSINGQTLRELFFASLTWLKNTSTIHQFTQRFSCS